VVLADKQGRPRIRMQPGPDAAPSLEFLDEDGKVPQGFPATTGTARAPDRAWPPAPAVARRGPRRKAAAVTGSRFSGT